MGKMSDSAKEENLLSAIRAASDKAKPHGCICPPSAAVKALEKFVPVYEKWMDDHGDDERLIIHRTGNTFGDLRRARAALAERS